MGYGMMNGMGYVGGWAAMALGGAMMLLWFALLVGLVVLLVRWIGNTPSRNASGDALNTLKQRFARGELDTAEFEDRLQRLRVSE